MCIIYVKRLVSSECRRYGSHAVIPDLDRTHFLTQGYVDLVPENDAMPVQKINLNAGDRLTSLGVAVKVIKDIV